MAGEQWRVGVIHATPAAMDPVRQVFARDLPSATVLHFLDEGLIDGLHRFGGLTTALVRRLSVVFGQADSAGVDIVLTTCSGYSPVMGIMRQLCSVPVVTIDEVLFEEAIAAGEHIGLITTGASSLKTTGGGIEAEARRQGRTLRLTTATEPEAFAALGRGDVAEHDRRIAASACRLADAGVAAVVLGQASMSRALPAIGELAVPVLTSPVLAVARVARLLAERSS